MAIEQFGQSLLSQQRTRQQDIAKRQRRESRDVALGTLVGGIGDAYLKSKAENFLNNEANQAAKNNYKKYVNRASSVIDEYNKAVNFAGGEEAYLTDKRFNFLKLDAQKEMPDLINYNEGDINIELEAQAKEWAAANVGNFKEAYNSALQMGTQEEFEQALKSGYTGPANMADFLVSGIAGIFTGKKASNLKAASATRRRDAMIEAGKQIAAFDSAINAGWDVNSAEIFNKAIEEERIRKDEGIKTDKELPPTTITLQDKDITIKEKEVITKYRNGRTVTTREPDLTDPVTKDYYDKLYKTSQPIKSESETTANSLGFNVIKNTVISKDPLFGIETQVTTVEYDFGTGSKGIARFVTDEDKAIVRDNRNNLSGVYLTAPGIPDNTTALGIAEEYFGQMLISPDGKGSTPTTDSIKKRVDDLDTGVAVFTRAGLNLYMGDKSGEERVETLSNEFDALSRLTQLSMIHSFASQRAADGKLFNAAKGHTLDINTEPTEYSLDLIASFVELERTENPVRIDSDLMNNIVAEVNVEDIVKMDNEQLENLYSRLRGTTSTQRMFEEELFDIEKVGSEANMALSQIAFYTMTIGQEIQNRRNRLQRPMPSLSRPRRTEYL
jgi:hypothetical protein